MITTKQRAYLRGLANKQSAILQVGKEGITDSLIENIVLALEARELIKLSVLETAPIGAREAAEKCIEKISGAEPVQVIGRKFVIYRRNLKEQKIIFP